MDSKDHTLHLLQALHSPHSVARRLSETTRRNVRSPSGTLSPGDFGAAAHSLDDVASASFLSAARQWRMVKASLTSWPTATKKTPPLRSPLSSPSLANAVKSPTMLIWSGTTQRRNMDEGGDGEQYKSERRHKDGSLSVRNVNGAPEPCASLEEIAEAFIRVSELAERQGSHLVHDSSSLYHPALVRHHILGFIAPKCSQIEKYRRNIRHFSSSIEDPESSTQKRKSVEGNPECFRGQQKEDTTPSEEDEGQLEVDGRHSEAALVSALETIHETILSHNWSCSKDEKPETEKSPRNHGNEDAAIIGGERRAALSSSLPSMPLLCGLDYYRCGTFAPALVLMFGNLPAICKWWEVSQAVIWAPLQQMSTQCEGAHLPYGTSKDYRSDHFLAGEKLCVLFFVLPLFLWLEEEGQPGIMGKFRSTRHLGIASVSDTKHNDYLAAEIRQSFFESINPITAEAIVDSLGFEWGEKEKDLHPLRSDNRTHRGVDGEEEDDPMRVENRPNSQINRQRIQTLLGFDAFYDALIIAPANSDDAEKDEHITPLSATQAILPPSTTKLFSSSTHLPLHPDEFPRIPLLTMLRLVVFLTSPVGVIHRRQMLQLLPSPQQLQALDRCWCMANLGLVSCGVLGARVYMKLGQDEKAAEALRLTLAYSRKRFVRAQCHTLLAKLRYRSYKMAATAILEAAMASSVAEGPGIPPTDKRTSPLKVQQIKLERSANYATMAEEVESHLTKALGEATSGSLFLLEVVIAVLWQDLLGQMPIDTPENLFDGSTDTEENDAEAAGNFSMEAEVLLEAACSKLGRTRNELSPLLEKPMAADKSGGEDSCDDHEDKIDDDEDEGEEHVEVISSTNLKEHLAAPTVVGDTHRLEAIHEENSEDEMPSTRMLSKKAVSVPISQTFGSSHTHGNGTSVVHKKRRSILKKTSRRGTVLPQTHRRDRKKMSITFNLMHEEKDDTVRIKGHRRPVSVGLDRDSTRREMLVQGISNASKSKSVAAMVVNGSSASSDSSIGGCDSDGNDNTGNDERRGSDLDIIALAEALEQSQQQELQTNTASGGSVGDRSSGSGLAGLFQAVGLASSTVGERRSARQRGRSVSHAAES